MSGSNIKKNIQPSRIMFDILSFNVLWGTLIRYKCTGLAIQRLDTDIQNRTDRPVTRASVVTRHSFCQGGCEQKCLMLNLSVWGNSVLRIDQTKTYIKTGSFLFSFFNDLQIKDFSWPICSMESEIIPSEGNVFGKCLMQELMD